MPVQFLRLGGSARHAVRASHHRQRADQFARAGSAVVPTKARADPGSILSRERVMWPIDFNALRDGGRKDERADIVRWLRAQSEFLWDAGDKHASATMRLASERIAAGAHSGVADERMDQEEP